MEKNEENEKYIKQIFKLTPHFSFRKQARHLTRYLLFKLQKLHKGMWIKSGFINYPGST